MGFFGAAVSIFALIAFFLFLIGTTVGHWILLFLLTWAVLHIIMRKNTNARR